MIKVEKSLLVSALSIGLSMGASAVLAGGSDGCDKDHCKPVAICHNIGGPRDLGANCDMTGNCSYTLYDDGSNPVTYVVTPNHFLGIIIPPTSAGAIAAHIAHGDGEVIMEFDPPLHLASDGQNHQASNVECLAERIIEQPPEPGN